MPKRSLSDLVLDTIDIISARKNRPNLLRIYRHLNRLYDLNLQTCEQLIQALLIEGKVIRVTYKGHISYRNALKWKKYSYYMKKNMGSELPGSLLTNAISELVVEEPDYLNIGVPYDILEKHLLSLQDNSLNKETLQKLLQRELKLESLRQYENGNYFLGPKPPEAFMYDKSDSCFKREKLSNELLFHRVSPDSSYNVINIEDTGCFSDHSSKGPDDNHGNVQMDNPLSKITVKNMTREDSPSFMKVTSVKKSKLEEDVTVSENKTIICIKDHKLSSNSTLKNIIIDKFSYHKISNDCKAIKGQNSNFKDIKKVDGSKSKSLLVNNNKIGNSSLKHVELNDNDVCNDMKLANIISLNNDLVDTVNVNKIIGIESNDDSLIDTSTSAEVSAVQSNSHAIPSKDSNSTEEEKESTNSLILERAKRKKKTKYDASDYYFPSLKRKSRETDTEKKDEKRRKKKKKENCPANLSGSFAKRVMFPGNTSMCCECRCYVSKVKLDPMIFCTTCSNQGHQSCAVKMMNGKNWYCIDCRQDAKLCQVCESMPHEHDRGVLYMCNHCGDHYHKSCHKPAIKLPFSNSWHCFSCSSQELKKSDGANENNQKRGINNEILTRPKSSECTEVTNEYNVVYFEDAPPNPTGWTTKDVYNYFKKYFDEDVAQGLFEQDLDGESLKLIERDDVLNLDFKLGTRLKVLMHIRRLQLCTNYLPALWES